MRLASKGLLLIGAVLAGCMSNVARPPTGPAQNGTDWRPNWLPPRFRSAPGVNELPPTPTLPRPRLLWRRSGFAVDRSVQPFPPNSGILSVAEPGIVKIDPGGNRQFLLDVRTGRDRARTGKSQPVSASVVLSSRGPRITAFRNTDASRRQPLWSEDDAADEDGAWTDPVVTGGSAYLLKPHELIQRDAVSGRLLRRWPLPTYLDKHVRRHGVVLLADGQRFAVVLRDRLELYGLIITADASSSSLVVLDRPMPIAEQCTLVENALVMYNTYDGVVGAYDLAALEPPLASLAPASAVAAVRAEMAGEERLLCDRLALLDNLGAYWLEVAQKPVDSLWVCALLNLAGNPPSGAGEILRKLARNPPDGRGEPDDPLWLIVEALAADDELETSRTLVGLLKEAMTIGPQSDRARDLTGVVRTQLWRTGRTSEFGFCPARARSRHVPELTVRASDGTIGTRHPLLFQNMSADGRWALVCQARSDTDHDGKLEVVIGRHGDVLGEEMRPYLVVESGPGWSFDEFIAADPQGRYVAVREGPCLSFVDTRTASVVTVPDADLRDDGRLGPNRSVAFNAQGSQVAYLKGGAKQQLVIRDLASGSERSVDPGGGLVWTFRFDEQGKWLELDVIPSGRWPQIFTTAAHRDCRGPAASYSVFGGVASIVRLLPLGGGAASEGPNILGAFGGDALVRRKDLSLALRSASGAEKVVVPASCQGHVLHADSRRRLVLVACAPNKRGSPLWLFGPSGGRRIGTIIPVQGDYWGAPADRVVEAAGRDVYVDLDAARIVTAPAPAPGRVRLLHDSESVNKGHVALRSDGAILTQAPSDPDDWAVPVGPLTWRRPRTK